MNRKEELDGCAGHCCERAEVSSCSRHLLEHTRRQYDMIGHSEQTINNEQIVVDTVDCIIG